MKNSDKMPSPSTKAFAILHNTNSLREGASKVADVIVTLLGIFY